RRAPTRRRLDRGHAQAARRVDGTPGAQPLRVGKRPGRLEPGVEALRPARAFPIDAIAVRLKSPRRLTVARGPKTYATYAAGGCGTPLARFPRRNARVRAVHLRALALPSCDPRNHDDGAGRRLYGRRPRHAG